MNARLHPALHWAEPFIAYAFAKAGRTTVAVPEKDETDPAQAVGLCIRDPETGAPWFGPITLSEMIEELMRVLNFLAPGGPDGNFLLRIEKDHLRLEWNQALAARKGEPE